MTPWTLLGWAFAASLSLLMLITAVLVVVGFVRDIADENDDGLDNMEDR